MHGAERGKIFYVGGAGPIGQVIGTIDVPQGLRRGGYKGAFETFTWQSMVGGTLRDQMDRDRNLGQARRLALRIEDYVQHYPGRPVHVIALSGGTGIAAWALESLPEGCRVENVIFLSSSLSRGYDLTGALQHIDGRLYAFSSTNDPILRYMVPIAGSIDREFGLDDAGGLYGFALPSGNDAETRRLYRDKLRNRPYRSRYARYGYRGLHTDATSERFVRHVLTPLLLTPLVVEDEPEATTHPATTAPAGDPTPGARTPAPDRRD